MNATKTLSEMRNNQIFNDLTPEQMTVLTPLLKRKTVGGGGTIFIENMRGESLYMIEQGKVRISRMLGEGDEQVMAVLGPSDVFGEMAVFSPGERAASARAVEDTELLTLSRNDYEHLAQTDPSLCLQLTRNLVNLFLDRHRASQQTYHDMLSAVADHSS